ncbi:TonB-dependent receptor [Mangrovivirga sp. M17]|uniref:TonB-dependent receptor n=1 Tax=Mangrovivirga halotolerans TaxID=2993936 RepID=A0ABT3RWL1_9BACT|nr:TonB-dependent receptor [Mangrovivirga halotolerans]MCX2745911.1 TonB-dependent receptor [Mangrovivirga halotolerans]
MSEYRKLTTKEKALKINLDPYVYGSFAEIGAGQEVAAQFFKAGGSSGTVAKTMSAYDMQFSDAIYGKCKRYVCEARLMQMLNKEYGLLAKRLTQRVPNTKFFAFANTVETLNYKKTNEGHGWIGFRFQLSPESEPNDCIIHVRLNDHDLQRQQQALGTIGVNLIHSCLYVAVERDPEKFLESLVEGLSRERVEIDMFKITGPDFKNVDNRLMSLKLVKIGLSELAMFGPDGKTMQPSETLYKKNIHVLRGRFRPVTYVNIDMFIKGRTQFVKEPDVDQDKLITVAELTLNDLTSDGTIDDKDFLDRVDILCSLGTTVLISNYQKYFRLVSRLSKLNKKRKIGITLGIYNLERVFDESYYEDLDGGILESFGRLFGNNVKLYVYPAIKKDNEEIYTLENFKVPKNLTGLFNYLVENNKLEAINSIREDLQEYSENDHVLEMIKKGEPGWEKMVPSKVERAIKDNCLFDYPCEVINEKVEVKKESENR